MQIDIIVIITNEADRETDEGKDPVKGTGVFSKAGLCYQHAGDDDDQGKDQPDRQAFDESFFQNFCIHGLIFLSFSKKSYQIVLLFMMF